MNIAYTKAWELVIRNAKKQIPWQLLQIQYHKKNLASSSESSSSSISASPALVLFSPRICFSTILMVSESPGYNGVLAQDPMATWALNVCGLVLCWRWLTASLPTENARSASTEDAIQKRFSKDKNKNSESHLVQSKSQVPSLTPEDDAE